MNQPKYRPISPKKSQIRHSIPIVKENDKFIEFEKGFIEENPFKTPKVRKQNYDLEAIEN